jgi:hypothetical protein
VKGKKLLVVRREQKNFSSSDVGMAVGAALTSPLLTSMVPYMAGNSVLEKYRIQDPADAIADEIAALLQRRYGAADIQLVPIPLKWAVAEDRLISDAGANGGVIVNVQSERWALAQQFTMNGAEGIRYKFTHHAKVEVRDADTQESLLKLGCGLAEPKKGETAPTYDELMDDDASLLKQWMSAATADCVQRFTRKVDAPAAAGT